MNDAIPSAEEVRAVLAPLTMKQLDALEAASGVPATTIYKIKRGETANPGIETLRKFLPHVAVVLAAAEHPAPQPAQQPEPDRAAA